ncbi:MAG TPA: hypothetical protein ENI49_07430 [Thermoplasmatales archaeon]|nr:hypothetical protein [Thermoplasmatales archaeon]
MEHGSKIFMLCISTWRGIEERKKTYLREVKGGDNISRRGPASRQKHNRMVARIAEMYRARGYEVWADIPGYPQRPWSIYGYIPDVIAKKRGHITVIEVETIDTLYSRHDIQQRNAFKRWAKQKKTRHFRLFVAE